MEIAAWVMWMGLQILVLLVGVWRIRLSANPPEPVESIVWPAMVMVQLVFAITLSTILLCRWENLCLCTLSAILFELLAVLMSGYSSAAMGTGWISVVLWLVAIHFVMKSPRQSIQSLFLVFLLLLSFAGPIGWYLEVEYGSNIRPIHGILTYFSPTLGSILCCNQPTQILKVGIFPSFLILISILRIVIQSKTKRTLPGII